MNILVIDNFDNITRCAAIFVEDQIKEFHKQGHNVRVLIPIAWGKKDFFKYRLSPIVREVVIDDIPHVFVRYLSASRYGNDGFNTKSALKTVNLHLNKILNGFIPDVIHAHKLGFGSNIGAEIKRRYSCPLVVTTHGSDALIPIKLGLEKNICAWSNEADALVAVSSRIERMVISTGTKTKTYVILNGHVCRDFINDTRHRKFPITILQVSSLIPQKRLI